MITKKLKLYNKQNSLKNFYTEFSSIITVIRIKKTLRSKNYMLHVDEISKKIIKKYDNKYNFEKDGIDVESIIIKVKAKNPLTAYYKSLDKLYKVSAYLSGIYQVPFFISDTSNYNVYHHYYNNFKERWQKRIIGCSRIGPSLAIPNIRFPKQDYCLIENLPDFNKFKKYEDIFYLWRSATDFYNELGWRFLNYIRIIEKFTKKSRGKKRKNIIMYNALPQSVKEIISKNKFVRIISNWGNPIVHGNMPNVVIPKIPHGYYNQHQDISELFKIAKILIKKLINNL